MLVIRYLKRKLNESQAAKICKLPQTNDLEELRNSFNESLKTVNDQTSTEMRNLRESLHRDLKCGLEDMKHFMLEEMKQALMEHTRVASSADVDETVAIHSP